MEGFGILMALLIACVWVIAGPIWVMRFDIEKIKRPKWQRECIALVMFIIGGPIVWLIGLMILLTWLLTGQNSKQQRENLYK